MSFYVYQRLAKGLYVRYAIPAIAIQLAIFSVFLYFAWKIIAVSLIIFVCLIACLILWPRTQNEPAADRRRLSSPSKPFKAADEREQLILISKEIEPGIFRSDEGIFLVRGPRGGSKVYLTLHGAQTAKAKQKVRNESANTR